MYNKHSETYASVCEKKPRVIGGLKDGLALFCGSLYTSKAQGGGSFLLPSAL